MASPASDASTPQTSTSEGGVAPTDAATLALEPVEHERVTLDFDDLADGTEITSQFAPRVTFSSSAGCACKASSSVGYAHDADDVEGNFVYGVTSK